MGDAPMGGSGGRGHPFAPTLLNMSKSTQRARFYWSSPPG